MSFDWMETSAGAEELLANKPKRKLTASVQPKVEEIKTPPNRDYIPYPAYTKLPTADKQTLRELDELEQKVLEKAAVIGVVKKLRESNAYLEFDPKLREEKLKAELDAQFKLVENLQKKLEYLVELSRDVWEKRANVENIARLEEAYEGAHEVFVQEYHRLGELSKQLYSGK